MYSSFWETISQVLNLLDQGKAGAALEVIQRCEALMTSRRLEEARNEATVPHSATSGAAGAGADAPPASSGLWQHLESPFCVDLSLETLWLDVARGRALSVLSDYDRAEQPLRHARHRVVEALGGGTPDVTEAQGRSASTETRNRPTGNRPDTAHLLLVLAACDAALGEMFHRRTRFREAIEHFRNALADLRAAGETRPAIACDNDTGPASRNHDSGDASNASEAHSCARACARGRNDKQGHADSCSSAPDLLGAGGIEREAARVKVMMAESLMSCGEFSEAGALSDEALQTFSKTGDLAWRGRAAKAKGTIFWYQDKFNEALRWYEKAEADLLASGMTVQAAFVNNNRGLVYWKINQTAEAVTLFEKARPVVASAGMQTEAATIDVNTSLALASLGRTEEALALLDRAGAIFEGLGVSQKAGWVDYYKGKILAESGCHREAIERFRRAKERFDDQAIDTYRAQAGLYLGLCQLELGAFDEARPAFEQALDVAAARDVPDLAFPALYGLARVTERVDPARALDLYKGSIREIERMRRSLAEDRLKTSFVLDKTRVYDAAVSLAADLDRHLDAFALMERAKGQAFVDSLKVASGAGGTEVQGDGSAEAWDTAADPLSFAAAILTAEKAVDAIVEYYLLPQRLLVFVATAPGPAAGRRVAGHKPGGLADPGEVQTDLITVAVDMSAVDDLVAWLYTDVEVIQSAPASFVATNMAQFLASWNDHARALYDVLIAPLGDRIAGRRRLLVVPHGPLHHVPFHALHDGRRYLVDSHETFFAPSLGALEAIWRKGHRTVRTCIAIGAKDEAAPLAEEECARIARLFGPGNARLVVGGDATVNALSQNAEGFDVVHVAGHSVFDPQDPMRSHIRLADGDLSALDLFQMRITCALVMLSACQTGVAYVSSGDELLGLSRGVFHSGASSLAASLWKVNDEATVDLAVEFYRALLAGRTKPEALRRAALRTRSRLRHPYYWAPFVLLGDPGPA